MKNFESQFGPAVDYLKSKGFTNAPVGIMLGTGMSSVSGIIEDKRRVPLTEIPGLPQSAVAFQSPSISYGRIGGTPVVCTDGRFHFYEGLTMREVVSIVYVMRCLGVGRLFINSAVGGINSSYHPGDLVLVNDHINLSTANPLIGLRGQHGKMVFPNMIGAYHAETISLLKLSAAKNSISLKEGVLAYLPGPAFETRSELRLLAALGADLVGWSMVPEVIFARALGIETAGICCISDISDPGVAQEASIDDIVEVCENAAGSLAAILTNAVKTMMPAQKL